MSEVAEERRVIAPEFREAVARALRIVGSRADPDAYAKSLWTNSLIQAAATRGDPYQTIANPHYLGGNVDKIESTIRSMNR